MESEKHILKLKWKVSRARNFEGGLFLPVIKSYDKSILIKTCAYYNQIDNQIVHLKEM